jgi:ribosomal protein L44E
MNRLEFETKLNEVYGGSVAPVTAYINNRATLVFQCSKCGVKFFGKPSHMVGK